MPVLIRCDTEPRSAGVNHLGGIRSRRSQIPEAPKLTSAEEHSLPSDAAQKLQRGAQTSATDMAKHGRRLSRGQGPMVELQVNHQPLKPRLDATTGAHSRLTSTSSSSPSTSLQRLTTLSSQPRTSRSCQRISFQANGLTSRSLCLSAAPGSQNPLALCSILTPTRGCSHSLATTSRRYRKTRSLAAKSGFALAAGNTPLCESLLGQQQPVIVQQPTRQWQWCNSKECAPTVGGDSRTTSGYMYLLESELEWRERNRY